MLAGAGRACACRSPVLFPPPSNRNPKPVLDFTAAFLFPLYHKFLYGVGKTFLAHVFPNEKKAVTMTHKWVASPVARARIAARASEVELPASAGRPYYNVEKHYKTYTMEEMCMFWCTLAPWVLRGTWSDNDQDPCYKMAVLLHRACKILFNSVDARGGEDIGAAMGYMQQYCRLAQQHLPFTICTPNLHAGIHLGLQEANTGNVGATNELWIERFIRSVCRSLAGRATTNAAAFILNEHLLRVRVASLSGLLDVRVGRWYTAATRLCGFRDEVDADGRYFSSPGKRVTVDDDELVAEFEAYIEAAEVDLPGFSSFGAACDTPGAVTIYEFQTAACNGVEVHADTYTLSRSRDSRHVAVHAREGAGGALVESFARVERLFRITVGTTTLRLAFVSTFKLSAAAAGLATGRPVPIVDPTTLMDTNVLNRVVDLASITRVVLLAPIEDRHGTAGGVARAPDHCSYVLPVIKN